MEIRKLNIGEHGRTRPLYETVFAGDERAFVDYYYEWKTRDNVIYVAEDETGIHSMVHLNPFRIWWKGEICRLHYIVAVATEERYRHRGLMKSLLQRAEQDMAEAGEEMTFLMPASEAIYRPFGYRFFGWQKRGLLRAEMPNAVEISNAAEKGTPRAVCRPLEPADWQSAADFANELLAKQYDFFAYRDENYYRRLDVEQRCQNGQVRGIFLARRLIGLFCTALECAPSKLPDSDRAAENGGSCGAAGNDDSCGAAGQTAPGSVGNSRLSLREVIFDPLHCREVQSCLQAYIADWGSCPVEGCMDGLMLEQEEQVPLMMGKLLRKSRTTAADEKAAEESDGSGRKTAEESGGSERKAAEESDGSELTAVAQAVFLNEVV